MIVAQLRGVEFYSANGWMFPQGWDKTKAMMALMDVAAALGFKKGAGYLDALEIEGPNIWARLHPQKWG